MNSEQGALPLGETTTASTVVRRKTRDDLAEVFTASLLQLVRDGIGGNERGAERIAKLMASDVPWWVEDPDAFRKSMLEALSQGHRVQNLRFAHDEIPLEQESGRRLVEVDPTPDGAGLAMPPVVQTHLEEIVAERRKAKALRIAGVGLTRTVLLSGPPGVGKTLAAKWLAAKLKLPLVSLDLATCVSSYLGTSGRNIAAVFDYARSGKCVLLLDEFDAIAKRRDDAADIGELKRVVNVILLELDKWPDSSLLVAATNHAQLLDSAIDRRFDRSVEVPVPQAEQRRAILKHFATETAAGVKASGGTVPGVVANTMCASPDVLKTIAQDTDGATGSDLDRLWRTAVRRAIISTTPLDDVLRTELTALTTRLAEKNKNTTPGPRRKSTAAAAA